MKSQRELARLLAGRDRTPSGLSTPQVQYSSLEDGSLKEYDQDGKLVLEIGKQWDGSHGAFPLTGPNPPRPTAPTVEAGTSVSVGWDGLFLDGDGLVDLLITAPMDWSRVEIHLSRDPDFQADTTETLVDTIETPRGGSRPALPAPGTWYAALVARSLAGKRSEQSPVTRFEVIEGVDGPEVQRLRDTLAETAAELVRVKHDVDVELPQQIDAAAASPITDDRLPKDGSLTRWPFATGTIPSGALEPGAVGASELADFSIIARKLKTNQHIIY